MVRLEEPKLGIYNLYLQIEQRRSAQYCPLLVTLWILNKISGSQWVLFQICANMYITVFNCLSKYCPNLTNILHRKGIMKGIMKATHKDLAMQLLCTEWALIVISSCGKCAKLQDFDQYFCSTEYNILLKWKILSVKYWLTLTAFKWYFYWANWKQYILFFTKDL